ncbi:MAG: ABC transporter substrate-binding protein [Rhodospirillales bacterium]|nr:ABC transporter substrate-binding protein [Rhodospirillales bacterium]
MRNRMSRRRLLGTSAAGLALAGTGFPRLGRAGEKAVKIGFLAPMSGDYVDWGLPGLYGCEIWAETINAQGGLKIGDDTYKIEFVGYDDEAETDKALQGAKKLVLEDGVKFILMLGGNYSGVQTFVNQEKMLVSTLLPSDMSPDTPYLIAPCEVHPFYNVTGVEWLAKNRPELKTAAVVYPDDSLGLPSLATYRAAFEAEGIGIVTEKAYPDEASADFTALTTALLASKADILCLDTCGAGAVTQITEQAFLQGFKGQIISCTLDYYKQVTEKTSKEFVEGFIYQFPNFDDPAMQAKQINFPDPKGFYDAYVAKYPDAWSAVSWEYTSIMVLWAEAAQKAGSVEPLKVLEAMKAGGKGPHVFGEGKWWGTELLGIDNALVGNWPVVVMRDGVPTIAEFRSVAAWIDKHTDLLIKHMTDLKQMPDQRA